MRKLPLIVFFVFIIVGLCVAVTPMRYTVKHLFNPHTSSTSNTDHSPYLKAFEGIISLKAYYNGSTGSYKEYLWDSLGTNLTRTCTDMMACPCNVIPFQVKREFINASEESVKSGNTIGALLLGDVMNGLSISLLFSSFEIKYQAACMVHYKLERLHLYEGLALREYGEPPFNLTALERLNNRVHRYVLPYYSSLNLTPINGTQEISWSPALMSLMSDLIRNASLLNNFSANYSPNKTVELLESFTRVVKSNIYLESIFKPALNYLATYVYGDLNLLEVGRPDLVEAQVVKKTPKTIEEFYLRVFYAWYNIVKPYELYER